jgi:hypothetical protein
MSFKKWREANIEKDRQSSRQWAENNKSKHNENARRWRKENLEYARLQDRIRQQVDRHGSAYRAMLRYTRKLNATPSWANQNAINQVYLMARFMTDSTGVTWHVDHIVPLRGKTVCGLHVEHNLTFIPAAWNIAKGNQFNDWK